MQKQYLFGRRPLLGKQACHEAGMHYGSELQLPFFAVGKRMHLKKLRMREYFTPSPRLSCGAMPKEEIK
ncbi:MAG: hypothetical protein MR400_04900 [Clostridiales bacterium]|nr:hypothetical protein [Clostridiales bacterium]